MNWYNHCLQTCLFACLAVAQFVSGAERVQRDLLVLYDFEERSGAVVHDRSGIAPPLDLRIDKPAAARWRNGSLVVSSPASISSAKPAAKIHEAIRHSNSLTIEDREKGGLNLGRRVRALEGGNGGAVLVSGDSAANRLIHLVAAIDKDAVMPPQGDRLTSEQVGILRAWIDQGLAWPAAADVPEPRIEQARTHWALQPLRAIELPAIENTNWVCTPIDRFILAALKGKGLEPTPAIDPGRMIRRISFDLAGLPPDVALVEQFCDAAERDRTGAIAELVDRLLDSRHYGERWGRHWLDVVRYADSDGMESDADRPSAYHYRDFVIQAINEDMPFDTFLQLQLAGDEIEPGNLRAEAATGFLTAGPNQPLEPKHLEEERLRNRYNELDDMISTLGTGILGLTLGCARCHDHKYDAVRSREYYRMLSALHSGDRKQVKIGPDGTEALVFRDFGGEPRPTWLFGRGNFYDRDQPVELGFLDILSKDRTAADYWQDARGNRSRADTTYQRKAMAAWITDTEHGAGALAARVIVNRVWKHHFGEGLVRTVSDFGVRGETPSHPELLEWLTHDFVTHGWKLKRLHRMIMTSAVYQQGSKYDAGKAAIDAENRLLWCKPLQRLEAEIVRDTMLAVSGMLNLQPYGPAFKPPISAEAMLARNTKTPYPTDAKDDATTRRRSVYMFHKRVVPYPLLQVFDRPDAQQPCGRRDQTTVAPQGLALLNDAFVRERAVEFANRLLAETQDDQQLVARSFQLALARLPAEGERAASIEFLIAQAERRQLRNPGKPAAEARLEAVADYCQSIFGLNEFIYVD
jgi:hypothetical protein